MIVFHTRSIGVVTKSFHIQAGNDFQHSREFVLMRRVCLDAGGGVWTTFPILFPSVSVGFFFHSTITALLAFYTLFNYMLAAFIPAGPPPPVEWGQVEVVDRGRLENYRFCDHCQKPKHPAAHHCRTCRACVMEMDHHCPFVCQYFLTISSFFYGRC